MAEVTRASCGASFLGNSQITELLSEPVGELLTFCFLFWPSSFRGGWRAEVASRLEVKVATTRRVSPSLTR